MYRTLFFCLLTSSFTFGQVKRIVSLKQSNTLSPQLTCNDWLYLPTQPSFVNIGDLDVTGNKITVEGVVNRTSFYANGILTDGDIVSKHSGPTDVNYILRPTRALISTSNGFFYTPEVCPIELNKTYHFAMVYDGASLKFYRNGFLMSRVAATGNLIQNNWSTQIGLFQPQNLNENLIGYVNEVRVWNVARTQSQIQAYLNSSLPSPTTQTGLLAYYIFDNLQNKQGNTAWNGTLSGSGTINQTNPNCTFLADSCNVPTAISGIINNYTAVLALNPCNNSITVEDASAFNTGDTVLMIQMKGAIIDSGNTPTFGTITGYKNAGNYEFNYIKSKAGNTIELKNALTRQYDIPTGKVQLVRVPYYNTVIVSSTLTCLPWDGNKGGILVLNAKDRVELNANIDVAGKGFSGGKIINPKINSFYCHENEYYYSNDPVRAAPKGEGIASISIAKSFGRGPLANGGGGGQEHNSGGAGGSNGSSGGKGGKEWISCGTPSDNGGIGGNPLNYNNSLNKIFLGGGAGAGHCNNLPGFNSNGGNGGGIVILHANFLKSNNKQIIANGNPGTECVRDNQPYKCHEGMGGGGAGGSILLNVATFSDNLILDNRGGKGADMNGEIQGQLGPGGGGSGGVNWFNTNSLPQNAVIAKNGGLNGVNKDFGNDGYGATAGTDGINLFNLIIPVDTILFKRNIDSLTIKDSVISCNSFDFKGIAYTNSNPVSNWQWDFGDGGIANIQNANHAFAPGTYSIKLLITDVNGCKDSISKSISASLLSLDAGMDTTICNAGSTVLQGNHQGGIQFAWTPAQYLNDSTLLNPTAAPATTTKFYLVAKNAQGCSVSDSVTVNIRTSNTFSISPPDSICKNDSVRLHASGGDLYSWSPGNNLNTPDVIVFPQTTINYSVKITDTICNASDTLHTLITVLPLPAVKASKSNDIDCTSSFSQLNATGANLYSWFPLNFLNNTNIPNPVATPMASIEYVVTGTDANGCRNKDSVKIDVSFADKKDNVIYNAFSPNGDGLNDCFSIKHWSGVQQLEFSIYNRWGERVFYSNNANKCWNGIYKGKPQDAAVFVYLIKAKTNCGDVNKKGTLFLIR